MNDKLKAAAKKIPGLATAYRNVRDYRLARRAPKMTPFGFSMIGNDAMQNGTFEQDETKLFRALLKDKDVLVNAGANTGYYCLHALGMHKYVIAFEPMPKNTALLRKNIAINGWDNDAEVFEMALGDRSGTVEVYGMGTGASLIKGWGGFSPKRPLIVPLSSLDITVGDRLQGKKVFVLIDVEGAEYNLLLGARRLLGATPKPTWMVEITLHENQPGERPINPNFLPTFELFWQYGYEAYGIRENGGMMLMDHKGVKAAAISGRKSVAPNIIFIDRSIDQKGRFMLT